ncbi:unnamed protein product, partial [Ixodes hexagonus]
FAGGWSQRSRLTVSTGTGHTRDSYRRASFVNAGAEKHVTLLELVPNTNQDKEQAAAHGKEKAPQTGGSVRFAVPNNQFKPDSRNNNNNSSSSSSRAAAYD